MFAAVGAGNQMLATILDPAERRSELPSEPGDAQLFRLQHAFVAEAAAHVGRDHAHAALRDPEMLGDRGADHVRHLRRGMDHELVAARLPVRQHGLAFERVHRLPRHAVAAPHHDRRGQRRRRRCPCRTPSAGTGCPSRPRAPARPARHAPQSHRRRRAAVRGRAPCARQGPRPRRASRPRTSRRLHRRSGPCRAPAADTRTT